MELIQLHRAFPYRQPPNILTYTFLYSFLQGFFFILIDHLWAICQSHSSHSKMIIVGTIVMTKLPIGVCYLVKIFGRRFQQRGQTKKPFQPQVPWRCLLIPSVFRILLYVVVLLVLQVGKTYYLAIGFAPNLIVGEILFQYNTMQSSTNLTPRIIGVFFISLGAVIGVTDRNYHLNPSLYLIFLATSIFVVHGEVYLNNKILKLYKPSKQQLISKYFVIEVLMFLGSYLISVFLQYMEIVNQGISIAEFIQYLLAEPYFFAFSIVWVLTFGSLLHIVYFSLLEVSTTSQHVYFISSALVWFQLYSLTRKFLWTTLVTVMLGLFGMVVYIPSARGKIKRLIVFLARRSDYVDDD